MFTLILIAVLVISGIVIEKKYSPRIAIQDSAVYFHYSATKGVRNKKKLF